MADEDDELEHDGEGELYPDLDQEEADRYQKQADVNAQVREDLLSNARYDEFFAAYQPEARADFAHYYAMYRQRWVEDGENQERLSLRRYSLLEREAYASLWAIQQKKLFDLQCRWRAEEVRDVPGVVISDDFETLSLTIENCPAVPPITPDELALYLDWVRQADYARDLNDLNDQRWAWQNYRLVRDTLARDAPPPGGRAKPTAKGLPDWYRFHNQHTGHGRLLQLPDVRGHKEERYWDAWREGQREQEAIRAAAGPPPDPRPRYVANEDKDRLIAEFARCFEAPRINRWRELSELEHPRVTEEQRQLQFIITRMQVSREPIPVAAGADWREATRQAHYAHCHRKLLELLPLAYEEYRQRLEWGISQPSRLEWDPLKYNLAPMYRQWLLDGRTRLGEPADFDF